MTGRHWRQDALVSAQTEPTILIRVVESMGSAPRDAGTRMLVTADGQAGTIGGGNLEYQAVAKARHMLKQADATTKLLRFPLGPLLGQCCGGNVAVLLERIKPSDWTAIAEASAEDWLHTDIAAGTHKIVAADEAKTLIAAGKRAPLHLLGDRANPTAILEPLSTDLAQLMLFGAGHVGQALVQALAPLPIAVHWVDSRADQFPKTLPENTLRICTGDPVSAIEKAPREAAYLVMTHDHGLDYDLVAAILARGDARYVGLIGSRSKRVQFERRLAKEAGYTPEIIASVTCPIGLAGIGGKEPAIIAASVAAELLSVLSPARANSGNKNKD